MSDSNNDAPELPPVAFIGGGNIANAVIGGLLRQGLAPSDIDVVDPSAEARERLARSHAVSVHEEADPALARAGIVLWAVKPQVFAQAARAAAAHTAGALHLSVAAGIRSDSIARWLGTERIVRAMPNTPALIGLGMTGLFARAGASDADRTLAAQVIASTGQHLWVADEVQLDAVTALSGSGPAYVFYFLEAMTQAGCELGLSTDQARTLAIATFTGAAELARASHEAPEQLRARVTSEGGTTHAAITAMDRSDIKGQFVNAMHAARRRAAELGDEFGSR